MAHSGELDAKHHELIQEELDEKIAQLKLKLTIAPMSLDEMVQDSALKKIFGKDIALQSV